MNACEGGGGILPPEGGSNLQPVLRHASVVCAQNWSAGARLRGGDANMLAEELEPGWLTAHLLRVPESFGCYISQHSTRSACRLTALAHQSRLHRATPKRESCTPSLGYTRISSTRS